MKKYLLIIIFLILSFTGCNTLENNQTKIGKSPNYSDQTVNQSAKSLPEISGANAKQKFNPAEIIHFATGNTVLRNGGSSNALLTLKIDEPFHVNSNPPSEKNFIPLKVDFESSNDVTVGKPVYPKGELKTFAFSEKPLSVYAGEITIKLPLKTNRATTGEQTLNGKLKFQACDEEVCYPPQTVDVQLPVAIN